jgi:DNA-binding IclR family transcriptional regulator
MANLWERYGGMASLVEPVLANLADETSRTAVFAIADGSYVRAVAAVDGGALPMRNHPLVGEFYPAHAGATSRAYFAFLSPKERQGLMYERPLARFSEYTRLDAEAIEQSMIETEQMGWAYSEGEYDQNTRAVAAPVFVADRPIGSVSIGENKRENLGDIRKHTDAVLRTASAISQLLSLRSTTSDRKRP